MLETQRVVHVKQTHSAAPAWCDSLDVPIADRKMFCPPHRPRVEDFNDLIGFGINRRKIWPLPQIASRARPGQAVRVVVSAMNARDNVINVEWQIECVFGNVTVLTSTAAPLSNPFSR